MDSAFVIRDAQWPQDRAAAETFIAGLQQYELAFESNRRIDAAVGPEYFDVLMQRVAEQQGRVFIAEAGARPIGWSVLVVEHHPIYVIEEQRTYGYIAELFVEEAFRGRGIGRALIGACEDEGRARGLKLMMIGVIPANRRAAETYAKAGYAPYSMELRKRL